VFFVDPESTIRAILYYPQELGRNFDEFVRMMKAFQVSDKHKVAMPANWPHNELIGDQVIISPATDVETARKRKEEYDNFDWWFCYKKV
ncbi:MAG TPA: hypothetical protein PLL34_05380, partial [Candidatus Mcinerneyibacteriales bacterium]|nr:hypothetical protein [Candidatus Mcinerneyibacteriales bacterium]